MRVPLAHFSGVTYRRFANGLDERRGEHNAKLAAHHKKQRRGASRRFETA